MAGNALIGWSGGRAPLYKATTIRPAGCAASARATVHHGSGKSDSTLEARVNDAYIGEEWIWWPDRRRGQKNKMYGAREKESRGQNPGSITGTA